MSKFIFSFGIITLSLLFGYGLKQLSERKIIRLPLSTDELRKLLQKAALWFCVPLTIVGAIWIVDIRSVSIAAFPFLGMLAFLLGGGFALAASRFLHLTSQQAGAFFACGYFSNVGSIGGLVSYLFLGEQGFALMSLYKLLEPISFYAIGFSVTKTYSVHHSKDITLSARLKILGKDPFILIGISALLLGGFLNLSGIARPAYFATLNAVFIPLGTIFLLVSIGLALQFHKIAGYWRESIIIALIKFFAVPVCMTLAAWLLGYGTVHDGLPLKAVMILASMPVAFNAMVATSIYDLDLDLANSCFLFSTLCLAGVLPLLYYLLQLI